MIKSFGCFDNKEVNKFVISSDILEVEIINFGAIITSIKPYGKDNILLSYPDLDGYINDTYFLGATIVPNANRVRDAKFNLNNQIYKLENNDNGNNLHSSLNGSHKRVWDVLRVQENLIELGLPMKDLELGFPGNRVFAVAFKVHDDILSITYNIYTDQLTIFNPTNHMYFKCNQDLDDVVLKLNCSKYTPIDNNSIPTNEILEVINTPMDFLRPTKVSNQINQDYQQLELGKGYDHNYLIDNYNGHLKELAIVETNNYQMIISTNMPSVQFYSGNYLLEPFGFRRGVALETQFTPNAINMDGFDIPIVDNKKIYQTIYQFINK